MSLTARFIEVRKLPITPLWWVIERQAKHKQHCFFPPLKSLRVAFATEKETLRDNSLPQTLCHFGVFLLYLPVTGQWPCEAVKDFATFASQSQILPSTTHHLCLWLAWSLELGFAPSLPTLKLHPSFPLFYFAVSPKFTYTVLAAVFFVRSLEYL